MRQRKKILLISYYGRVCLSTKVLSAVLRDAGHQTHLIYLKDDRSTQVDTINPDSKCFQFIRADIGGAIYGSGTDVNPVTPIEMDLLAQKALEIDPDVVALSSRSVHLDLSRTVSRRLKAVLPRARFIAGGYGPSLEPEKYLEFVDYVCIGKGDSAIIDLVEQADPASSPNVASIINGRLHVSALDNPRDLDARPFADWGLENKIMIEDDTVFPLHTKYDPKSYVVIASEGCPSNCTYCQACQWPSIYALYGGRAKKVVMRSPDNVIAELKEAKAKLNITGLSWISMTDMSPCLFSVTPMLALRTVSSWNGSRIRACFRPRSAYSRSTNGREARSWEETYPTNGSSHLPRK